LISYVKDRPGHDLRYADASKINKDWWKPSVLSKKDWRTVTWYLENQTWLNNITSGEYATYYEKQYYRRFHGLDTNFTVMSKLVFKDETYKIRELACWCIKV
jgi:hypothetical protein